MFFLEYEHVWNLFSEEGQNSLNENNSTLVIAWVNRSASSLSRKVCALRPRWEHTFVRAKVRLVSNPHLQSSTGLSLSSLSQFMLNCCPKVNNHPRAFLSAKEGCHQTPTNPWAAHLWQQAPWMLTGDLCPSPHSLTTPFVLSWTTKGKGDSHPQMFGSPAERWGEAYSEHWPISFSLLLLTVCFHWKEFEGLLRPGQSSPMCAVQSGLVLPAQLSWSGLVGCSKGTRSYLHPPM